MLGVYVTKLTRTKTEIVQKPENSDAKVICNKPCILTGVIYHMHIHISLRQYTAHTVDLQHGSVYYCRENDVTLTPCTTGMKGTFHGR